MTRLTSGLRIVFETYIVIVMGMNYRLEIMFVCMFDSQ